jgi:hypothetical protein
MASHGASGHPSVSLELFYRLGPPGQRLVEFDPSGMSECRDQMKHRLDGLGIPLEGASQRPEQWRDGGSSHAVCHLVPDSSPSALRLEQSARLEGPQVLAGHGQRQTQLAGDLRDVLAGFMENPFKYLQAFAIR